MKRKIKSKDVESVRKPGRIIEECVLQEEK